MAINPFFFKKPHSQLFNRGLIIGIEIKDDIINDISVSNSSRKCVYIDANVEKSLYSLNLTGYAKGVYYIAIQGIHKQYKKKNIIN